MHVFCYLMKFWKYIAYSPGERKIMGHLEDAEARLDKIEQTVKDVDAAVELLHDEVKALTGNGITQAAADRLNVKFDAIEKALGSVPTDDEAPMPPEPTPT